MDIADFLSQHWTWVTGNPVAFVVWTAIVIVATYLITRHLLGDAAAAARERSESWKEDAERAQRELSHVRSDLAKLQNQYVGGTPVTIDDKPVAPAEPDDDGLPWDMDSAELFAWRIGQAFPGVAGEVEVVHGAAAVERIRALLREPIYCRDPAGQEQYPFWWFRGSRNMHIENFKTTGPTTVILNQHEFRISRAAGVRIFNDRVRDFVYVEAEADEPTGLYDTTPAEIARRLEENERLGLGRFVAEEYAQWVGIPITRAQYDDNAVVIDGRPMQTLGAEPRVRHVTPYNFIVCGRIHVINSIPHEDEIGDILDRMLKREADVADLVHKVGNLPARRGDFD